MGSFEVTVAEAILLLSLVGWEKGDLDG